MQDDKRQSNYQYRISRLSTQQKQALAKKLGLPQANRKETLLACVTTENKQFIDSNELKEFAQARLPEHCVPQLFKQVQILPRSAVGKIDRKQAASFAWQELEQDEDSIFDIFGGSEYVAPRNEMEKQLADIWSDVLGISDISIHDEFLEVGGDSLLSIRILSRINKAGLSIATEDFFTYPTIAGQANAISKASEHSFEEGSTKGAFSLIPIQHWLFERVSPNPKQWNQSVLISTHETLDYASLGRAWQQVLLQHDALRSVFSKSDSGQWHQAFAPLQSTMELDCVDCSELNKTDRQAMIDKHCQNMNQTIELQAGNLARLTFFNTPLGSENLLAIVVHHLVIDAESWRILLEDLQQFWQSFAQGNKPEVGRKTTSFKHWSEKLNEYAKSASLFDELPYWLAQSSQMQFPNDFSAVATDNTEASSDVLSIVIDKPLSDLLVHQLPKLLKIGTKDILIWALVTSLQKHLKTDEVLIDIEAHGREELFNRVNLSRTIGWFTTVFPVLFKHSQHTTTIDSVVATSQVINAIPKKGIGHGLLREYIQESGLKEQAYSPVCFNFLGQTDTIDTSNNADYFNVVASNIGQPRDPKYLRAFTLEVNARIEQEQVHIDWSFSHRLHKTETIEQITRTYINSLSSLEEADIMQGNEDDDELFDLSDLEGSELDAISKTLNDN